MKLRSSQWGAVNGLVLLVITLSVALVAAGVFGLWAYGGRQDYKNNVESKIQAAVASNTKQVQTTDANHYTDAAKQPYKTYVGPSQFRSVTVMYPKTWSAYVVENDSGSTPIDAYFHSDVVPDITAQNSTYNLRVQVTQTSYDQILNQYTQQVQQGNVTITPYSLPKVPSVQGVRIDGQISQNTQGSLIVLPLSDKTLKIWTESTSFLPDFNGIILKYLTFSP